MSRNLFLAVAFLMILSVRSAFPCAGFYYSSPFEMTGKSFFEYSVVNDSYFLYSYPNLGLPANPNTPDIYGSSQQILDDINEDLQKAANLKDWRAYLGNHPAVRSISNLLYGQEESLKILNDKQAALDYIDYIRRVADSTKRPSWYENEDAESKIENRTKLYEEALERASSVPDSFIKARYGFQAVRLAELLEMHEDAIRLFTSHVAPYGQSGYVYYSSLGYKARAHWKMGQMQEALKSYRILFDQSKAHFLTAWLSVQRIAASSKDWDSSRVAAQNDYVRSSLWLLQELDSGRPDDLTALENIIKLSPKSSHPEVVMLRKILALEPDYLSGVVKANAIPLKLAAFCEKTAEVPNIRTKEFWQIAGAYLRYLGKDHSAALRNLQAMKVEGVKNRAIIEQSKLISLLVKLDSAKLSQDAQLQKDLAKTLLWAKTLKSHPNNWKIAFSIYEKLGYKYLSEGEMGRAAASFFKAENSVMEWQTLYDKSSDSDLQSTFAFVKRVNPQPLDVEILDGFSYDANEIVFLRARKMIEKERYDQAHALLQPLAPSFWKKEGHRILVSSAVPEVMIRMPGTGARHFSTPNHYASEFPRLFKEITLLEYARIMRSLVPLAQGENKEASEASMALGNIYYTMPYSGFVLQNGSDEIRLRRAVGYYKKAAELSSDPKIQYQATILFGLSSKDLGEGDYQDSGFVWNAQTKAVLKRLLGKHQANQNLKSYAASCPDLVNIQ